MIKKILKDELTLHASVVFLGTILVGVCNLAYHLISVRLLSPEDYGTFNALVSFVMFTSMAVSPLGTTLTRYFTEYIAKREFDKLVFVALSLFKKIAVISLLIGVFFFIFSPYLALFLKTKSSYVMICGGIIIFSLFLPPVVSLFQSFQRFFVYSLIGTASSLGKLIAGASFMFLGWKILGGLLGFFAGPIFMILTASAFVPGILRKEIGPLNFKHLEKTSLKPVYRYFFPVAAAMLSFTFLTTIDVILVKHFFSELEAGYYSIAQMVGKIALFLPSALAIVILPKSTKAHVTDGNSLKFLHKSLFLGGICCFVFTAVSFLLPEVLLNILAGKVNPVSRSLIGLFASAMSFYALCWIVINYLLAVHNLKFVLPLSIITILEAAAIYNCHHSLTVILYILLFSAVILFISLLLAVKSSRKMRYE